MSDKDPTEFDQCVDVSPKGPISTHSFSLATILLFTTLTAFILGTIMWELNIGIALLIVSLPALLRTMTITNRLKTRGVVMSFSEKIMCFGRSLAAAALIAGVVGGTFVGVMYYITTTSLSTVTPLLLIAILMLAISGSLGIVLIRIFWLPRK
jgi:hypothetical protein